MGDENQWRTTGFRQSVVQKINEAIVASGSNSSRNANEMENHVYQKARNKDEYLSFIARLILHVREMNSKNKNAQGPGDVNNVNGPGMPPDPINALQNMASPGTRNPQMMAQNNGGNMGGVGGNITASNLLQTLTQQRPGQQQQQQQIQTMQNIQNNRGGPMMPMAAGNNMQQGGNMSSGNMVNTINPGMMAMNSGNMNMGMNQLNQMTNVMPTQMVSGPMQLQQSGAMNPNPQMSMGNNMGQIPINPVMNQNQMVNQMNMNSPQINQNQMNQMASGINASGMNVAGLGQIGQMNPNNMNQMNANNAGGMVQQPQQMVPNTMNPQAVNAMAQQNQMPVGAQINPNQMMNVQAIGRKSQEMLMTNPGNVFQGVRSVTPNQFLRQSPSPQVPSPGMGQGYQGNQMVPSPALVPSPSPQMPNMMGQRSVPSVMAPSPSSSLNTPGQVVAVQSPFNPQEEQLYREKYRHLTKYIEPLKRMIARMGNDDVEKLLKMNKLLEILCNPSKRIPLETLLKCEKALEKMDFKSNVSGAAGTNLMIKEHQINNPLLEAINATLQSPLGNHTLQRTFRPCLEALFGPDIKNLPPAEKRPRFSTDDTAPSSGPVIPHTMQGEIARLDQKFKVSLDTSAQAGTKTIKLVCCLDDKHLPCVPPVTVSIPEDYPASSPNCNLIEQEYSASPFLASVQKALTSRISKLPRQYSLSHLLDTWEMSVRQACAPIPIKPTQGTVLLGI